MDMDGFDKAFKWFFVVFGLVFVGIVCLIVWMVVNGVQANANHDCNNPVMSNDRRCQGAWTKDKGNTSQE